MSAPPTVVVTGPQRWFLQGVAQSLQASGLEVHIRRMQEDHLPCDVVVAAGLEERDAAPMEAALPPDLAVLWLGHAPLQKVPRPWGHLASDVDDHRLAAAVRALAAGLSVHE